MDPLDSLPEALRETVEHALRAVHEHPEHQLLPIYRAAIYDAVGKSDEPQQHMFLATLAALTAKKALPFWTKEVNDEPLPQRLISMAESTLKGDLSEGRAEAAADWALERSASLFRELDKKTPNGLSVQAEGALLVAIAALYEASGVHTFTTFDAYRTDDTITDADLDFESSDTANWAAATFSGRAGEEDYDPIECQGFWRWWLLVAVPEAWNSL